MAHRDTQAPVTVEELLVTTLATSDALAKLLIEKGLVTQAELMAKISEDGRFINGAVNWRSGE